MEERQDCCILLKIYNVTQSEYVFESTIFYDTFCHFLFPSFSIPPRSLNLAIAIILIVAFFEYPSSITTGNSSDPRYRGDRLILPCGIMEAIEISCLLIFTADLIMKVIIVIIKPIFRRGTFERAAIRYAYWAVHGCFTNIVCSIGWLNDLTSLKYMKTWYNFKVLDSFHSCERQETSLWQTRLITLCRWG